MRKCHVIYAEYGGHRPEIPGRQGIAWVTASLHDPAPLRLKRSAGAKQFLSEVKRYEGLDREAENDRGGSEGRLLEGAEPMAASGLHFAITGATP